MVSLAVNHPVQPCFATGVQELAKHTLGKRGDTQGRKALLIVAILARWW